MIRLEPYSRAEYVARCRYVARQRVQAAFDTAAELVLEVVHPGNLGPLPPSPEVIKSKAVQLGIAKWADFRFDPRF